MGTRFSKMCIFVNNLQKMVAFYENALGCEIDFNNRYDFADFKHEGIDFSMRERDLLQEELGQSLTYPEGLNGTFELVIDLPTSADVDREFDRIVKAGGTPVYPPRDDLWAYYNAKIADPEGNLIEIGFFDKAMWHFGK